jgi:hypothetical protein
LTPSPTGCKDRAVRLAVRAFLAQLLAILTIVSLSSLASAASYPCDYSSEQGLWAVSGGTGVSGARWARGVNGMNDVQHKGIYQYSRRLESIYVWNDLDDFIEFGWEQVAPGGIVTPKVVYEARQYNGSYADSDLSNVSTGSHEFHMARQTDGRYKYRLDGTWHPTASRSPVWIGGAPWAGVETQNQCDSGAAHWWSLDYKGSDNLWRTWTLSSWVCDTMKGYAYVKLSETNFEVRPTTDQFTTPCDPLRLFR